MKVFALYICMRKLYKLFICVCFSGFLGLLLYAFLYFHTVKQLKYISDALLMYKQDTGMYPSLQQGLTALYFRPVLKPVPNNWNGPYLSQKGKKVSDIDLWGNFVIYSMEENLFIIKSFGKDNKPGGIGFNKDIQLYLEN